MATANADDFASRTEYDALNRPVRSFQPYDPADARYSDANMYTETVYDAAGRVTKTSMPASEGQTVRNESTVEYFDNGWIKNTTDPWDISTAYEYDDLGAQTARTLTSADGSANRTMTWGYFPDGKLLSKADDGVPVGSHSVVTDNNTTGLAEATGTWATLWTAPDQQGTNHRTHAAVTGTSTDKFTWTLDVPADGTYSVAVTYPQVSGAATDAKFELTHGKGGDGHGGVVTEPAYTVNQTTGAGAWKTVGEVELVKGDPVTVTLKPSTTGKVVADAVRLVRDNSADVDTEARAFAYSYDVNGNLTGINDTSSGARADDYQITYTGLNQVATVREALAGQETATTSYSYDVLGQPLTVNHPDQASTYTYDLAVDPRGPLTRVSVDDLNDAGGAKTTSYTYDNRGMRATETKANGNVVTNGYFLDGALKSMREEKSGGALVASHAYTYDNNGNKATDGASKMNADVATAYLESTTTYSYDPVDRLAQSVKTGNGAKTETYVHDDNANVISQDVGGTAATYSYDRNRLLTATADGATASYRYDPFGRQTSAVSAGLTISRTTYDGYDHIAESEKMNDAGVLESTTYAYDPLDRTASKTAGGETTDYTYLGLSSEVLGEEVAGELTKSYQYSPWGLRLSQITHQADPEQGIEAGEDAYYGYNAHTDVETLTDDSGNAVATYGYTAYGNADESEYTGIDKPEAGAPEDAEPYNAYRYNSKRWDAGSGTYDMGFRDYAPGLNRFTTRDMYNGALADMGLGSDLYTGNRYAFTAGNPISRVESDGHIWEGWSTPQRFSYSGSEGGYLKDLYYEGGSSSSKTVPGSNTPIGDPEKTVAHAVETAIPDLLAGIIDSALVGIDEWADRMSRNLSQFDRSPIVSGPWDQGLPETDPGYWGNRQRVTGATVAGEVLKGIRAVIPNLRDEWHDIARSSSWRRGMALVGPVGLVPTAASYMRKNDGMVGLSLLQTGMEELVATAGAGVGAAVLGSVAGGLSDGALAPVGATIGAFGGAWAGSEAGESASEDILGGIWKGLGWSW